MKAINLTIKTERLLLKPISLKYLNDIFKEFTEEISFFMFSSSPKRISEAEKSIIDSVEKIKINQEAQQVIMNVSTGEFLGCVSLHHIDTSTPAFGVWLKKSAHGNKYGQEAVRALKNWAESNLEYEYLKYNVAVENVSSRKVVESVGGKIEREFVGKKQDGRKMNKIEYRIYK